MNVTKEAAFANLYMCTEKFVCDGDTRKVLNASIGIIAQAIGIPMQNGMIPHYTQIAEQIQKKSVKEKAAPEMNREQRRAQSKKDLAKAKANVAAQMKSQKGKH